MSPHHFSLKYCSFFAVTFTFIVTGLPSSSLTIRAEAVTSPR